MLGIAMNAFLYPGGSGLRLSLIGMAAGFGVYFILYALRVMRADDVKLMAAVGAAVGWADSLGIVVVSALVGGITAAILIVARRSPRAPGLAQGAVIALGTLFFLGLSAHYAR